MPSRVHTLRMVRAKRWDRPPPSPPIQPASSSSVTAWGAGVGWVEDEDDEFIPLAGQVEDGEGQERRAATNRSEEDSELDRVDMDLVLR